MAHVTYLPPRREKHATGAMRVFWITAALLACFCMPFAVGALGLGIWALEPTLAGPGLLALLLIGLTINTALDRLGYS